MDPKMPGLVVLMLDQEFISIIAETENMISS